MHLGAARRYDMGTSGGSAQLGLGLGLSQKLGSSGSAALHNVSLEILLVNQGSSPGSLQQKPTLTHGATRILPGVRQLRT